jgi:hypothetical protein
MIMAKHCVLFTESSKSSNNLTARIPSSRKTAVAARHAKKTHVTSRSKTISGTVRGARERCHMTARRVVKISIVVYFLKIRYVTAQ